MNHTNVTQLRYFLLFLAGFTVVSLFLLTKTTSYQTATFSADPTTFRAPNKIIESHVRTVTVPKLPHAIKRKLGASKNRGNVTEFTSSQNASMSSTKVGKAAEKIGGNPVGTKADKKITMKEDTATLHRDYQKRKENTSNKVKKILAEKGLPPDWRSFIPKGAKIGRPRERRTNKAIFSKEPAKWPPAIDWPEEWIRPVNISDVEDVAVGRPVTCNMQKLSETLRPELPAHFEEREFHSLPARYSDIVLPRQQPLCGTSGLVYPWKLIQQQSTENTQKRKIWMLFVVKSAPAYKENRAAVRETWGSQENFSKHKIFALFVVGRTNDENVTQSLLLENKKYGDLLQCDFLDHYRKLPIKVLSTFRWMLERDFDIDFFTMTDDDCLVHLPNMAEFFDTNVTIHEDYYKNVYCDFRHHVDALPSRKNNKWVVTSDEYSGNVYPTFCHGGLWTVSRPLMHGIYCVSEITKIGDFFLEDVLITGILREKLNFKATNIKRVGPKISADRSYMMFHAGYQNTAESATNKMMKEWRSWKDNNWKLNISKINSKISKSSKISKINRT